VYFSINKERCVMAELKITELPALTVVIEEDLLAIVDDPTGTASTKKVRIENVKLAILDYIAIQVFS